MPYDPYRIPGGGSGAPAPEPAARWRPPRPPGRTWRQRGALAAGGIVVTLCLLGMAVGGYVLHENSKLKRVNDLSITSAPAGAPENYLIVAIDTRDGLKIKNTDTIIVVRIDPQSDRVALTSFNRDLMVRIADTGKLGMINSAYSRPNGGEQVLIDTIRQNFDIPINHFVEVNFESFKQVVDAVGGVPMWFPYAVRDKHSGLYQIQTGCVTVHGDQGLAFARSRYFQIMRPDGTWKQDGSADIDRVQRQQIFIERSMTKALAQVKSNPLRMRQLLDIGVSNVRIDKNLSIGDLLKLGKHFRNFDPSKLEAYPLPVTEYPPNPDRLLLDAGAAEPFLNVFRGLAPGEIRPGLVDVAVENGTGGQKPTLAGDVSGALQKIGFQLAAPADASTVYPRTTIFFAPGQASFGQRVARHLSLASPQMMEDRSLPSGHVRLVAGLDFTTVHQEPSPLTAPPKPAPQPGAKPGATPATTAAPRPTAPPPPTTTTTAPTGFLVGNPPPGKHC